MSADKYSNSSVNYALVMLLPGNDVVSGHIIRNFIIKWGKSNTLYIRLSYKKANLHAHNSFIIN